MTDCLIDRLIDRINETAPIVVGLDPNLGQIPAFLKEAAFLAQGKTPAAVAATFTAFNRAIIDQICDIVPAVKPQIAMYEQFGVPGMECYLQTVAYAKAKGLIVIGDVKRGDIASTAKAYSDAHLGRADIDGAATEIFATDFVTVNPYMGYDAISPYLADCAAYDRGLFVLVKTSNPHSFEIQDIEAKDGRPIYEHVGDLVSTWGAGLMGRHGYSAIGAVVGATHPAEATRLREIMPHTFFLVPGYGAQGGTAQDLKGAFDAQGGGAIVNSSRGITGAYQTEKYQRFGPEGFAHAAREAVLDMQKDLESVMP